jgi:lysyl-tRNA synthetase class I
MDLNNLDPDQIKGLISLLQNLLPNEVSSSSSSVKKKSSSKKTNTTQSKNKNDKTKSGNKFDQMAEFRMHKEDVAVDKKLSKFPPVPRTRQFTPIEVICRVCGKKEKVNPGVLESIDRYKCNKCCSSNG